MVDHANKAGNLILIGFMGTGKTSVGRRVAQSLNFEFVDTDELIVQQEGKEIATIFAEQGESVFRQIETQILTDCCQEKNQVISTGGGIVVRPQNHTILQQGGQVIWLKASASTVYERVKRSNDRPLLATDDPEKTITELLEARAASYTKCADLIISTDDLSLEETVYGVTETARFWQADGRL